MAYGPNLLGFFRQGGVLAAKILQGAKPAETPVETPTKFEFVLNLKTAAQLGITFPASLLLRADEEIEYRTYLLQRPNPPPLNSSYQPRRTFSHHSNAQL